LVALTYLFIYYSALFFPFISPTLCIKGGFSVDL